MDLNSCIVESCAKKEIRVKGGIRHAEMIYVMSTSPIRTFALRIFLSSLLLRRHDISFVSEIKEASLVLRDDSLDSVSADMLHAVLNGTVYQYLTSPAIRTICPFSSVNETEISVYAAANGWHASCDDIKLPETLFLDGMVGSRPGTKFALKNIRDKLVFLSNEV